MPALLRAANTSCNTIGHEYHSPLNEQVIMISDNQMKMLIAMPASKLNLLTRNPVYADNGIESVFVHPRFIELAGLIQLSAYAKDPAWQQHDLSNMLVYVGMVGRSNVRLVEVNAHLASCGMLTLRRSALEFAKPVMS
ncbi:hypothetical protein Ea357_030 [Erwinia phage Ea35-70]|jgi:hypothetical protein|uniref:Uncharacterized protein n=3 Tax=Agricanvirus TaxID=1984776 RepID=W6AT06_9CAUD|nr:hypothetical protein Ea357_030 [Erwinia phage Ea35-70]AHI60180.1 hypothetical protein Ea357_030 [Erwinia phage Ea35-70]AUG86458.1 hypothetical protein MADMEL_30 [Erwinia phage vB_EamM_MadMel]